MIVARERRAGRSCYMCGLKFFEAIKQIFKAWSNRSVIGQAFYILGVQKIDTYDEIVDNPRPLRGPRPEKH